MSRCVVTHNGSTPHGALQATLSVVVHRTPCGGNSSKLQATITPVLAKYKSPPPDYPKLVRAMSSKSPRSTDQLMFRSQTLPTEIQEVCIDFVATGLEVVADAHQWLRTLRCCALTCRAWLPRARFYLFQSVVFTTLGELHRFVAAIPSRLHPGAQHVQGVDSNQRFTSTSVDKSPWRFTHLVPHYLANRLSQVVWLRLCEDGNKTAAFHRSFLMELSQFHAVKHLTLANYEFALFTDIHRLVASLKGLVTISLAEVHWDERPPKSLIRGTLWKVREVNLRNCTSLSSGVYLWTLPPPNALPPSFRGSKDENSHPAFTLHDAEIIKETVDLFSLSGSGSYTHTLKWEYNLFEELLELKSVDILVDLEEQEGKKVVEKIRSDLEATFAAGRLSIGVRDEPESDSESWWDDESRLVLRRGSALARYPLSFLRGDQGMGEYYLDQGQQRQRLPWNATTALTSGMYHPPAQAPYASTSVPRSSTPERVRGRQVPQIPEPYAHKPLDNEFYLDNAATGSAKPNIQLIRDHFLHEGRLEESQALWILGTVSELLRKEPNMLLVDGPVTVCGDIHGQFYDLLKILDIGGKLSSNRYLFLGDYVDRGCFGIECLLYLFALKLCYPRNLLLLRGNHECRHLTEYFTFKRECLHKYSPAVYEACIYSFQSLPVTALIDGKFFCVHGGISPELQVLSDLDKLDRFTEPPSHGLLNDLLWADPISSFGHENRRMSVLSPYVQVSYGSQIPPGGVVITSHVYKNRGAVIKYKDKNITIRQFNASAHPYWLPNFMDAFTWSLPFVGAKITDMLLAILAICSEEELGAEIEGFDDEIDKPEIEAEEGTRAVADIASKHISERREEIKAKVLAVGKINRVFQVLRQEAENVTELAPALDAAPDAPVPGSWPGSMGPDALGVHTNQIRSQIKSFDDARKSDRLNERLPQFTPDDIPQIPAPSMRHFYRADDTDPNGSTDLESMIRMALEEEGIEGIIAERLAERVATQKKAHARPRGLKRYETA
ncbi:hypothetical protein NLI96_g2141 [Meripilus lineatus]|uniref:Serine/threonine-protein phosphatase n=1 Tax=Meripilus lineatus TaxID=2056292 RepID=A0AAD5V9B1_9APHY|nr:hypothetical protein NLI96_g2141 [Physisporinus lineatus]